MVRVRTEVRRLAPLSRETVERFAPSSGGARRFAVEVEEALAAPVHPDSLRQILINLLDNAAKYGGEGPVTVRVDWPAGTSERFAVAKVGQRVTLTRGTGTPVSRP